MAGCLNGAGGAQGRVRVLGSGALAKAVDGSCCLRKYFHTILPLQLPGGLFLWLTWPRALLRMLELGVGSQGSEVQPALSPTIPAPLGRRWLNLAPVGTLASAHLKLPLSPGKGGQVLTCLEYSGWGQLRARGIRRPLPGETIPGKGKSGPRSPHRLPVRVRGSPKGSGPRSS